MFELSARLRGLQGWELVRARNRWFQRHAVRSLESLRQRSVVSGRSSSGPPTVFAYSYAAGDIFRWARAQGWRTVLGQIDPGLAEERLVAGLCASDPELACGWQPAPEEYWVQWREECELANCIVVNSDWSRRLLVGEGVPEEKIRLVPLAYAPPAGAAEFRRTVPEKFSSKRPLRALFLGQVNLRKGVGPLLEAVRLLRGEPVEFWFVGPEQIVVPEDLRRDSQVRWIGPVARGAAADFYRQADVFLFPTFSDGFGLTQLEAQAWHLPVIASKHCGNVVESNVNGVVLDEVSGDSIRAALLRCLQEPGFLQRCASRSAVAEVYSLARVGDQFLSLWDEQLKNFPSNS